jgi:cystathionine gamma-synthase
VAAGESRGAGVNHEMAPPRGEEPPVIHLKPATVLAQLSHYLDPATGGLVPPIQPSTTFARDESYALINPAHEYGRDQNPGYRQLEALLATLERGAEALVFPSGMAAIAALFRTVPPGGAVAVQDSLYFGTMLWLERFCARREIALHRFAGTDPDRIAAVVGAAAPAIVWIETPSNPMLHVVDIVAVAEIAHRAGAVLAVDGTVATPILTWPLALGADLVMHSATKYLNGHADVLAGALVTAQADERWAAIRADRHDAGALLGPFEAWLVLRGMRTLALRVREACGNALALARFLEDHPKVERVLYPGLPSHPQHDLARRQMDGGCGGLLSFQIKGDAVAALALAGRLRLIARATSLGGTESVIEHRFTIEGAATGVPPNLLRLSVGIEDEDDLIADLAQALDATGNRE